MRRSPDQSPCSDWPARLVRRCCALAGFLTLLTPAGGAAQTAEMMDYPIVRLQALDKIPARTITFDANVGSTVRFGSLYIKVQACRKSSPMEKPEAASFLQIWEISQQGKAAWVFSGWMFASSPALSYMDHAVYDVWVLDCLAAKGDDKKPEPGQLKEGEGQVSDDQVPAAPSMNGAPTP